MQWIRLKRNKKKIEYKHRQVIKMRKYLRNKEIRIKKLNIKRKRQNSKKKVKKFRKKN